MSTWTESALATVTSTHRVQYRQLLHKATRVLITRLGLQRFFMDGARRLALSS